MNLREMATRRVEAAWACVNVLCPELTEKCRKRLCERVLDVCRGEHKPQTQITPAQLQEIIWRNLQCVNRHCSVVLFSQQIAEELNEFFNADEGSD